MQPNTGMRWINRTEAGIECGLALAAPPSEVGAAAAAAGQCLKDTGAIKKCRHCGAVYLVTNDECAERAAYERAEHLRKAGLRAFQDLTQREVAESIRSTLEATPNFCPTCR